jgi:hypothetical protein
VMQAWKSSTKAFGLHQPKSLKALVMKACI